jgi:hypothetical protein
MQRPITSFLRNISTASNSSSGISPPGWSTKPDVVSHFSGVRSRSHLDASKIPSSAGVVLVNFKKRNLLQSPSAKEKGNFPRLQLNGESRADSTNATLPEVIDAAGVAGPPARKRDQSSWPFFHQLFTKDPTNQLLHVSLARSAWSSDPIRPSIRLSVLCRRQAEQSLKRLRELTAIGVIEPIRNLLHTHVRLDQKIRRQSCAHSPSEVPKVHSCMTGQELPDPTVLQRAIRPASLRVSLPSLSASASTIRFRNQTGNSRQRPGAPVRIRMSLLAIGLFACAQNFRILQFDIRLGWGTTIVSTDLFMSIIDVYARGVWAASEAAYNLIFRSARFHQRAVALSSES